MTFANGWTVSVQWGHGNYCDGRHVHPYLPEGDHEDRNAEVARWHPDVNGGQMDEPLGWQSPDEVAAFIAETAAFPATVTA